MLANHAPPESCKVYTPPPLARAIVRALSDAANASWLEPSYGNGVFLRAISDLAVTRERVRAIDLDCSASADDVLARVKRGVDFLAWSSTTSERFDRIVGNPPYVAISQLPASQRRVAACVSGFDGLPIGSCANTWYAFVLSALRLLRDGGSMGFILPSAVEYAEYASPLRTAIRYQFESLDLFRCRRPLFDDVQEGTVVVIARGYKRGPLRFRRREFSNAASLVAGLTRECSDGLRRCRVALPTTSSTAVTLSQVADIRLGGVTGDSKFFLLTEIERNSHQLPATACTPVVSKARHLSTAIISRADWEKLRLAGERVWLFNPRGVAVRHPEVQRYLGLAVDKGGCNRSAYKIKGRAPWYNTPLPKQPHGFISGMSRHGPWISLNDFADLNATNTLYVITFAPRISADQRYGYALSFLCSRVQRQLRKTARRYADGLIKYEPSSITSLRLPPLPQRADIRSLYQEAVRCLLAGERHAARRIADDVMPIE